MKAKRYNMLNGLVRECVRVNLAFYLEIDQVVNLWMHRFGRETQFHPDTGALLYFHFPRTAREIADMVKPALWSAGIDRADDEEHDLVVDDDAQAAALAAAVVKLKERVRRLLHYTPPDQGEGRGVPPVRRLLDSRG